MSDVDVLIPTCGRPAALAVTLSALVGQTYRPLRIVVSDQTDDIDVAEVGEVKAVVGVLRARGNEVEFLKNLPRRGLAHQRQFLLDHAHARYALFLDDDVITEPRLVERLVAIIERERCGFIGAFVNAPGALWSENDADVPPPDVTFEFWDGPVEPELVLPDTEAWQRSRLHFAAYPYRVARRLGLDGRDRLYKVAWVGGCVLADVEKLRAVGGFSFWRDLPVEHCGEDVLAQLRLMATYGGAAVFPSGAWHQEVPTTSANRDVDAPYVLPVV